MKIKRKDVPQFTLTVSEKELDWIQLAIGCMLRQPGTHQNWHDRLTPIRAQMMKTLGLEEV